MNIARPHQKLRTREAAEAALINTVQETKRLYEQLVQRRDQAGKERSLAVDSLRTGAFQKADPADDPAHQALLSRKATLDSPMRAPRGRKRITMLTTKMNTTNMSAPETKRRRSGATCIYGGAGFDGVTLKHSAPRLLLAAFLFTLLLVPLRADAAVQGRYVRLEAPERLAIGEDKRDIYRLMEIEVSSEGVNVALAGKVTSSGAGGPGGGDLAKVIDGNNDDFNVSSFSVPAQVNPWIEIDLGRVCDIDAIKVYTLGSLSPAVSGMWLVSALDGERKAAWYQRSNLLGFGRVNEFKLTAFPGRYVGKQVPEGAKGWYGFVGELASERNI